MTYLAEWGSRGPIVFGVVMGVGWFIAFSIAKLVRERAERGQPVALKLTRSFLSIAVYVLLFLSGAVILIAVLAGEPAVAVPTAFWPFPS